MKYMAALVVVKSIEKTRKLYEDVLGLKVTADYEQNITFEGGFSLHEEEHFKMLVDGSQVTKRSNSFELYFEDDDIKSVYDKVVGHGLELLHELREQPWRQLVFRFYDYDKNIIEVGESMEHVAYRLSTEGLSIQEISRVTYISEQVVEQCIKKYS